MGVARTLVTWLMIIAPVIFLISIIVYPVLSLMGQFASSVNFSDLFGNSPEASLARDAVYNSLEQGILSSATSFVAGFPLGVILARIHPKLHRFYRSFILLPFFLPSIVVVLAFISLFGRGSPVTSLFPFMTALSSGLTGIIAVNTFFNAPLVAFLTSSGIERSDSRLEEAASTLGAGPLRIFSGIWGRDGIRAAMGAVVLTFLYSFAGFAAPLIIGGPQNYTIETWIYYSVKMLGDIPLGVLFSAVQSLTLLVPVIFYSYFMGKSRSEVSYDSGRMIRRKTNGFAGYAGSAYFSLYVLTEIVILGSIVFSSIDLGWKNNLNFSSYLSLFGTKIRLTFGISPFQPILNTMFYGFLTSVATVSLGLAWITGKRRVGIRSDSLIDSFQYIPLLIPAIVMAFSISVVIGNYISQSLTWVLIIAAQTGIAIPVTLRVISAGFSRIPASLSEASSVLGGNPLFEIELPLSGSVLATAVMFAFAISIGEFTATNFLSTSLFMPLSVEIYSLQSARLVQDSYAAASLLLGLSTLIFYIIQRIGERFVFIP